MPLKKKKNPDVVVAENKDLSTPLNKNMESQINSIKLQLLSKNSASEEYAIDVREWVYDMVQAYRGKNHLTAVIIQEALKNKPMDAELKNIFTNTKALMTDEKFENIVFSNKDPVQISKLINDSDRSINATKEYIESMSANNAIKETTMPDKLQEQQIAFRNELRGNMVILSDRIQTLLTDSKSNPNAQAKIVEQLLEFMQVTLKSDHPTSLLTSEVINNALKADESWMSNDNIAQSAKDYFIKESPQMVKDQKVELEAAFNSDFGIVPDHADDLDENVAQLLEYGHEELSLEKISPEELLLKKDILNSFQEMSAANSQTMSEIATYQAGDKTAKVKTLNENIQDKSISIIDKLAMSYNDPEALVRTAEHWIKVMETALNNNDPLTALIIHNALSIDPKSNTVNQNWMNDINISDSSKEIFKKSVEIFAGDDIKNALLDHLVNNDPQTDQAQQKARRMVSKVMNEMVDTQETFIKSMKDLHEFFDNASKPDIEQKNGINPFNPIVQTHAKRFANDLIQLTSSPFTEIKYGKDVDSAKDLENLTNNIEQMVSDFKSDNFKRNLAACRLGATNMLWISELDKDNPELNKKFQEKYIETGTTSDQFIKPNQRLMRYGILITELCRQIEKLEKEYKGSNSDEVQSNINRLSSLKTDLENINQEIAKENKAFNDNIADRAGPNKVIEYKLYKLSANPEVISIAQRLYNDNNPPRFKEVYSILRQIKSEHGVDTNELINKALVAENYNIKMELQNLRKLDDPDSRLKILNREVALHLLTHMKGLSPKTKATMIELADKLCQDKPLSTQEIGTALKQIHLSKKDKVNHRRINRAEIRNKINEHNQNETNTLGNHIIAEKAKSGHPASSEDILVYLNKLNSEWKDMGSTLTAKSDPAKYNEQRMRLVNDAITSINFYHEKKMIGDVNTVYVLLATKLSHLENGATAGKITDSTKVVIDQIQKIAAPVPVVEKRVVPNEVKSALDKHENIAIKKEEKVNPQQHEHDVKHSEEKKNLNPIHQKASAMFTTTRHSVDSLHHEKKGPDQKKETDEKESPRDVHTAHRIITINL